tara:strand:- start:196 stop:1029 length:834 start_codon:yes stop_codon:yes gene_type:complete
MRIRFTACLSATLLFWIPASVFAAPFGELWPYWASHVPDSPIDVDHQPWQRILDKHLSVNSDGINRVHYQNFTDRDKRHLDDYLDYLGALAPTQLSRGQQLPYWINLYNALTVRVVLQHPDKDSIKQMKSKLFSFGPWDDEQLQIEGFAITLNDIEHRILRPIWRDPRIHYAVNCASIGCPNLSAMAYTERNTTTLLAAAERAYLQHARGLAFDAGGVLRLSSIFDWYQEDFGRNEQALLEYLALVRTDIREQLLNYSHSIDFHYDWSLNSQRSTRD